MSRTDVRIPWRQTLHPDLVRKVDVAHAALRVASPLARASASSTTAPARPSYTRLEIPSNRDRARTYSVAIYSDGRGECECDAHTKWARGRDCSHIKLAREIVADPEFEA